MRRLGWWVGCVAKALETEQGRLRVRAAESLGPRLRQGLPMCTGCEFSAMNVLTKALEIGVAHII